GLQCTGQGGRKRVLRKVAELNGESAGEAATTPIKSNSFQDRYAADHKRVGWIVEPGRVLEAECPRSGVFINAQAHVAGGWWRSVVQNLSPVAVVLVEPFIDHLVVGDELHVPKADDCRAIRNLVLSYAGLSRH